MAKENDSAKYVNRSGARGRLEGAIVHLLEDASLLLLSENLF